MSYDKITIKSLANECFEDSFYKINAADLESKIEYMCIKYHKNELNKLAKHDVIKRDLPPWVRPTMMYLGMTIIVCWFISHVL